MSDLLYAVFRQIHASLYLLVSARDLTVQIFDHRWSRRLPGPRIAIGSISPPGRPATQSSVRTPEVQTPRVVPTLRAQSAPIGALSGSRIAPAQVTVCPVLNYISDLAAEWEGLCRQRASSEPWHQKGSVGVVRFVNFQTSSNIPSGPNGPRLRPEPSRSLNLSRAHVDFLSAGLRMLFDKKPDCESIRPCLESAPPPVYFFTPGISRKITSQFVMWHGGKQHFIVGGFLLRTRSCS